MYINGLVYFTGFQVWSDAKNLRRLNVVSSTCLFLLGKIYLGAYFTSYLLKNSLNSLIFGINFSALKLFLSISGVLILILILEA